jgi:hypothetical protein
VSETPREYGYLAIKRVHGGIVKFPDGSSETFDEYDRAYPAYQEWVTANLLPAAIDQAREKRQEYIAGCQVREKQTPQPGWMSRPLVQEEVVGPDGRTLYLTETLGEDHSERIASAAEKAFPDPEWLDVAKEHGGGPNEAIRQIVVWAAGLYLGNEYKRLPAFRYWDFGLPMESILAVLNDLAVEGWSVAHVSEDRGVFRGVTNQTDSAVTTARYLLARDGNDVTTRRTD